MSSENAAQNFYFLFSMQLKFYSYMQMEKFWRFCRIHNYIYILAVEKILYVAKFKCPTSCG